LSPPQSLRRGPLARRALVVLLALIGLTAGPAACRGLQRSDPSIDLSVADSGLVMVTATGLPADSAVSLRVSAPGQVQETVVRTSGAGRSAAQFRMESGEAAQVVTGTAQPLAHDGRPVSATVTLPGQTSGQASAQTQAADRGEPPSPGRSTAGTTSATRVPGRSASAADASAPLTVAPLPGHQVWAHVVPHGLPDFVEPGAPGYGSDFPLDLVPGGPAAPHRALSGMGRAREAGLTGVQVLQVDGINKGSDFIADWMDQADPTWQDVPSGNDFSIAPCLLVNSEDGAVRLISEYAAAAAGRPSAARVGDRLVVFVYAPHALSVAQWVDVRSRLARAALPVFLVGDLQVESSQHGYTVASELVAPYLSVFDASWLFDDGTPRIWPQVRTLLNDHRQPFAGGVMPGYDRETSAAGGYVDALGTERLRQEWSLAISSGASWTTLVTWNDAVEHTDIKAGSDWNVTRGDVTAFYSAMFRGVPSPRPRAELYVTTPTYVRLGESPRAEGLVLNGSSGPVTVYTQLVDAERRPWGPVVSTLVEPGTAGAATIADTAVVTDFPPGRFLRAHTWTQDASGQTVQDVVSAPVLVYDRAEQPSPMLRRQYYSVPAARVLPDPVRLSIQGRPSAITRASVTVGVPPGVDVRFADILHNTRQAGIGYSRSTWTVTVPQSPSTIIGGQVVSSVPGGFYVGRVIDENERVGYSDPIFVRPVMTVK